METKTKSITLTDIEELILHIDEVINGNGADADCSNSVHPDEMFLITSIYELESRRREDSNSSSECVRISTPLAIKLQEYIAQEMVRITQYHSMLLEGFLEDLKYGLRDSYHPSVMHTNLRVVTTYNMIKYLKEQLEALRNK